MKKSIQTLLTIALLLFAFTRCATKEEVNSLKDTQEYLLSHINSLEKILKAYDSKLFIISVRNVENGCIVEFSDGSSVTIVGKNGIDGKDGVNGKDGIDGKDGVDGKDGLNGQDGKDGEDGKDGDTLIDSIVVGDNEVTFTLTDGRVFSIPLYTALSINIDAASPFVIAPNSSASINYTIQSNITDVTVEVISSADIKAKVLPSTSKPLTGTLQIKTSGTIDEYSKAVLFASNCKKVAMKTLCLEATGLSSDSLLKEVSAASQTISLDFFSNIAYDVTVPDSARWWLSTVNTKTMEPQSAAVHVAENIGSERSANVVVTARDYDLSLTFTIHQEAGYTSSDYSQDGVVTLIQQATEGKGINFVLMGDGFSDRLIASGEYDRLMNVLAEHLFDEEPFTTFRNLFNVYSIKVVSPNEGYAQNTKTAFSVSFGWGTLTYGDNGKCFDYAKSIQNINLGESVEVVLINSDHDSGTCHSETPGTEYSGGAYWMGSGYGSGYGDGMSVAYLSTSIGERRMLDVLIHEACGHGFGKLADEYNNSETDPVPQNVLDSHNTYYFRYGWYRNIAFTSDPQAVAWSRFLNDSRYDSDGLGIYEGALANYGKGVWRSTYNSIMRHNSDGFNAPSREMIYNRIHHLAYGSSWTENHEDFVTYDLKNIGKHPTAPTKAPMGEPLINDFIIGTHGGERAAF